MKQYVGALILMISPLKGGSITITPKTSPLALASYTQAINTAGLIDTTFGTLGVVATTLGTAAQANAVVLQPDGKLVAAGQTTIAGVQEIALARYNTDGSLDLSFGTAGIATTSVVGGTAGAANAVVLQPDGKIVVAGTLTYGGNQQVAVVRYNTNGTLDTTFNAGGTVPGLVLTSITNVGGGFSTGQGVALQSNGEIVVVGRSDWNFGLGAGSFFFVVRYLANGTLDTTAFNAGTGYVVLNLPPEQASAVVIQPDGKIVVGGWDVYQRTPVNPNPGLGHAIVVARYLTNGTLDTGTFGNGLGYVDLQLGGGNPSTEGLGMVLQPDGKIVVVGGTNTGNANSLFVVARFTSSGVLDTATFGAGAGYVTTSLPGGTIGQANAVVLQPNNQLLVTGQITIGGLQQIALVRYNTDGSIDTSFGLSSAGIVTTIPVAAASSQGAGVALQGNGKIVVVGGSGGTKFLLVRYTNPFTLNTFSASYGAAGML